MTSFNKLNAYGIGFQIKVIGLLLTKRVFLINISDSLESEYFENTSHKWIVDYTIKYYNQYHTMPSMEVMSIEVKKVENEVLRISLTESLREAYKEADAKDSDWVTREFTNFCTNQQVKKAIMTSVDLLNMGDYEGIKSLINKALKAGTDKNVGMLYEKDVEARYRDDDREPIPFPWPVFNDLTQGGVGKGDLVLFFGNPGGGKSWACIAWAAYACLLGYNIIYYTLELSEAYVAKRFDAVLTGIPLDKLAKNRNHVEEVMKKLQGRLIIKEYPPRRASIDTIDSHITQVEQQEDIKVHGIVIDYIDYCKTKTRKDRKEEIDDVYVDAKALAKERGIPVVSPSQANRTGAGKDIIEGDNAAGSYDKIMIGDLIVSVARNRKNKINGTGMWHIMKNRYGIDGLTYSSTMDLSNGKIVINENPIDDDEIGQSNNKKKSSSTDISDDDRAILKNRFKNLTGDL